MIPFLLDQTFAYLYCDLPATGALSHTLHVVDRPLHTGMSFLPSLPSVNIYDVNACHAPPRQFEC
jgi:hypothetical protein